MIVTFYDWVETEAIETLRGLGVYCAHYMGKRQVYNCSAKAHWIATKIGSGFQNKEGLIPQLEDI